jgi:outer membrane lipoprotein-sorting protein
MCSNSNSTKGECDEFVASNFEVKSAKFKCTSEMAGQGAETSEIMVLIPNRMRMVMLGESEKVLIWDLEKRESLFLCPAKKIAIVTNHANMPKPEFPTLWFLGVTSHLLDARYIPADVEREPLGEKEIDGRRAAGYRLIGRGKVIEIWGDPNTGLPIRMEKTLAMHPNLKTVMSDFVFNVKLDESLFSMEPPADYMIQHLHSNWTPPEEKDLLETFRRYSQLKEGMFPESLDPQAAFDVLQMHWAKSTPKRDQKRDEQQLQGQMEELYMLTHGLGFAFKQFHPDADAHYAGKGVKLGAADTPIFWYRPKDSKTYRVIYADLSVKEAETPPDVPDAQAIGKVDDK